MMSTNAFAQSSDGDWKYTVTDADLKTAQLVSLVDSKKGTIENLEIPATVTGEGDVKYTITSIAANAFKDDAKIKTVTFTAAITEIGMDAFFNCYNLKTVTFPTGSKLARINNGAFAETAALEKIDLSNTQVIDLAGYTPFVKGENLNVSLEEIVLSVQTTDIGTALAGLSALKTTNIGATRILSLAANAFKGDKNLTSLVLPEVYYYIAETGEKEPNPRNFSFTAGALAGSSIQKLTVNGPIGDGGVDALGGDKLTEVTFNGVVGSGTAAAILGGAFDGHYGLAKITFGEVKKNALAATSFQHAGIDPEHADKAKGTVAVTIKTAADVVFAAANVFGAEVDKKNVNLSAPNEAVGALVLNRVNFSASETPTQIKVYGGSTYYGKFINRTGGAVAISRDDAIVYSAYVDGSKLYMDPLQNVKGQQIIGADQAVILKAVKEPKEDAEGGYKYIEVAKKADGTPINTIRHNGTKYVNDLSFLTIGATEDLPTEADYITAATLKTKDATGKKVLYVCADLTQGLKWQTPKDAVRLYKNTVYFFADAAAAGGRLEIIWLDDSEEATAIKTVKKAEADNDAIYNLAGQKVSASYKGVVIKNGKKYIQK